MAITFGVTKHGGLYTESVEVEDTIQTVTFKGPDGVTKVIRAYDPKKKFTLKTRGEASGVAVGVDDPGIEGVTGGVSVIESVKNGEKNDDFPTAEVSGTNYPSATDVDGGRSGGGFAL